MTMYKCREIKEVLPIKCKLGLTTSSNGKQLIKVTIPPMSMTQETFRQLKNKVSFYGGLGWSTYDLEDGSGTWAFPNEKALDYLKERNDVVTFK